MACVVVGFGRSAYRGRGAQEQLPSFGSFCFLRSTFLIWRSLKMVLQFSVFFHRRFFFIVFIAIHVQTSYSFKMDKTCAIKHNCSMFNQLHVPAVLPSPSSSRRNELVYTRMLMLRKFVKSLSVFLVNLARKMNYKQMPLLYGVVL